MKFGNILEEEDAHYSIQRHENFLVPLEIRGCN